MFRVTNCKKRAPAMFPSNLLIEMGASHLMPFAIIEAKHYLDCPQCTD